MPVTLALLAAVATLDPARVRPGLPDRPRRPAVVAAGAGLVLAAVVAVAAAAGPVADALGVSEPSARIAAGVAVVVLAIRDLLVGPPPPEPALPGRWAALVPVAFPELASPSLVLLGFSVGLDHGTGVAAAVAATGLAAVVAVAAVPHHDRHRRRWRAGQALTAGVALAAGVAITVDGVTSV